jgi:nitrite reductase/ring-hydroxylating ferredoxin subunit
MVCAAKLNEIPNWGKKTVDIDGTQLLMVNIKGEIFACENECPHQGSPLAGGIIKEGPVLACPRHGYRFNLRTGECSDYPEYQLKVYPVKIDGDDVMVDLG